jgi:dolichol-phosphate mannosyltransferase
VDILIHARIIAGVALYKFSIVVPAYNEEENILPLFQRISEKRKRYNWNCELVIVDDNSSDGTGKIADRISAVKKWVRVVHRKGQLHGMGYTLKEGTRRANGAIIVWVMADLSDDLDRINDFIPLIDERGFDMVVGSRFISGGSSGNTSKYKAFASFRYSALSSTLFGIKVHDTTNAYRAFNRKVAALRLDSGDFAISPEQMIRASMAGYKLAEVPVTYTDRIAGKPKFKFVRMGVRYLGLFRLRLGTARRTGQT